MAGCMCFPHEPILPILISNVKHSVNLIRLLGSLVRKRRMLPEVHGAEAAYTSVT